ncbi:tyrosine-type recombinase/integrase [Pseudonocardia sp.]|uniref:tyrosine-type recombinase/integrase n=1 Tax=Pseudonocardia sp. TaxID=60912 RepID=UPI0026059A34|nr:tyrosine-type recombinase/integrase [Pseudonocardia sp.]
MAPSRAGRRRTRGAIDVLPSGGLRVRVYAGVDAVTGRRRNLVELIPPGPKAARQAEAARTRLLKQVDEQRQPRTNATVNQLLDQHFELSTWERSTRETYAGYATKHIRPLLGTVQVGALNARTFDSFHAELRRCRDHCGRTRYVDHRTPYEHKCDERCRTHTCKPLGAATIRQIHFILSGALKRAVRWGWISSNPIVFAETPPAPKAKPRPPSPEEAARILTEAWADPEWGTLVWLAIVTGVRRGELCALRWVDVDLSTGVISVSRSIGQRNRDTWEKDTKDHQHRRIAVDEETVGILAEHRRRLEERCAALGEPVPAGAYVFSLAPDNSTYMRPNSVSERYSDLADRLGIATSLHKLRHYSATELIAAGVDIRTVAGRLGHGGGGTTTLRVYAAWVSESDQRAAGNLGARMPARPSEPSARRRSADRAPFPYEVVAAALGAQIEAGELTDGEFLPGIKTLAVMHGVAVGTAHRAVNLLLESGQVEVVAGRGTRVGKAHPGAD